MAEEDIGSMLSRIRIAEKDDGILPLYTTWKQNEANVGRLRLVGKLLSRRRVNLNGLHNALMASWNPKHVFKFSEIGEKIYLFQFFDIGDLNKVIHRGLWNFSNSLFILKRFQASLTPEQYNFSTNPFWVRIFDVPVGLHSEQIGFMIGSSLGKVLEVDEGFKKAIRV
ncbi:hypothetical protein SLEP1_g32378 [Rubroshorea leprosula]|uniref:DUF4283 domain-containing protein n=1 Tax=Rubroshorea leprosula TaxID=152421 RepID=A0AAV5KD62_9ROSI|nr:hypothetical protein SLEP1_g32378 [Rubroshorea leprosula]